VQVLISRKVELATVLMRIEFGSVRSDYSLRSTHSSGPLREAVGG
jgi:hypothetical protein